MCDGAVSPEMQESSARKPIVTETTIQPLHQYILDITGFSHEHFDQAFAEELEKSLEKVLASDMDLEV